MASRILLADDSITIQKVVNLTFADEGIEVVAVSNGEVAERKLTEIDPDLVLADIFMPGKNGYELCEHIKQSPQFHNVPVVLLVGAFEPFDQNEARRVKADAHLTKPFESRNLVETVRKLIKDSGKPVTASLNPQQPVEETPAQAPPMPEMKPIAPPPVNIDFSAMSNNWPVTEVSTGFDAASEMRFDSLSHTSPLTIELGNTSQTAQSFDSGEQLSTEESSDNEIDDTLVMGSPFAANSSSNDSEPQDINISIGDPAEATEAASMVDEGDNLSTDSASTENAPVGVPSAFGHPMQEVIVDFDKSDELNQSLPDNIVSLDADAVVSSVDETGATVMAAVDMGEAAQPVSEQPVAEEVSAEDETIPMATVPESTGFEVTFDDDRQHAMSESLSPELLETDNPLGDVFVDERSQNADFAESDYDSSSAPLSDATSDDALDLTPQAAWAEPSPDTVSPHLSADYSAQSRFDTSAPTALYDSQAVAETNHSAVAVEEMPASEPAMETGSSFDVVMAATEGVAWQTTESEAALVPPSEAVSSEQWSPEPQFVAIDAETAKLDELQVETVPAETGFEFKPVAEQFSVAEPLTQTADVEPDADESSKPAAQASADLSSVSEAMIEEIVRRVVERMSSDVVREIAWEIVPDMVERVVKEVAQDCASKKA